MAGEGPYVDPDMQYANLISRLISPPDEQRSGTVEPQQVTSTQDPRLAVPDGEPPNPTLKTRPQPTAPVQPAQPAVPGPERRSRRACPARSQ